MSKLPFWFRLSLLYPIASLFLLLCGGLLPLTGYMSTDTGWVLGAIALVMNSPGAILIVPFWDFSHGYNALSPVAFGIIFLNWIIVIIPLSWMVSRLLPRLKSLL
jgi:hypothetical protein